MRYYHIDLLDFYRGTLSARRLGVLVRHLPAESAVVRALNGQMPWTNTDHRLADLWSLTFKAHFGEFREHPVRAEIEAQARKKAKTATAEVLSDKFQRRKRAYGLE